MYSTLKKAKFIAGISFIVESFTFAILSLVLFSKKKMLAKVFLLLSIVGGSVGAILIYKHLADCNDEYEELFDYDCCDDCDLFEDSEVIPEDETASESEFEN